ncbi:hypothetical protein [Oceanithermus desulfurans]|uniref:Uncharacterized protein n=2 Tax=Oceanithermus desulfurans TaxID=227924 RepID=A0A511RHY7_9DEIN|nr:hypothetical protein [Oceanithermus desulfurans]MBB6030901.1 hypothetical protein [Oceanithermus desulfurans]GEM88572.1 hypothetical protein ODE01S_00060 [Oceanithermus desulfurans NBRC 100063]
MQRLSAYVLKAALAWAALASVAVAGTDLLPLTFFHINGSDPRSRDPGYVSCLVGADGSAVEPFSSSRTALLLTPVWALAEAPDDAAETLRFLDRIVAVDHARQFTLVLFDPYPFPSSPPVREKLATSLRVPPPKIPTTLGLDRYGIRVAFECSASQQDRAREKIDTVGGAYLFDGNVLRYRYLIPSLSLDGRGYLDALRKNLVDFLSGLDVRASLHPLFLHDGRAIDLDDVLRGLPEGPVVLFRITGDEAYAAQRPRVVRKGDGPVALEPDGPAERKVYYMRTLAPRFVALGYRLVGVVPPGTPEESFAALKKTFSDWAFVAMPAPGTQFHEMETLLVLDREHRVVDTFTVVLYEPSHFPVGMDVEEFFDKLRSLEP